jgi:hypothetical protein
MRTKPIDIEKYTKLIKRLIKVIKPIGVTDIDFELKPTGSLNEFYMSVTYWIPSDSELLQKSNIPITDRRRYEWNSEIQKNINQWFDISVMITSSSLRRFF